MSGGQIVAVGNLIVCLVFFVGLCWYLFLGPGSSRWYRR